MGGGGESMGYRGMWEGCKTKTNKKQVYRGWIYDPVGVRWVASYC